MEFKQYLKQKKIKSPFIKDGKKMRLFTCLLGIGILLLPYRIQKKESIYFKKLSAIKRIINIIPNSEKTKR